MEGRESEGREEHDKENMEPAAGQPGLSGAVPEEMAVLGLESGWAHAPSGEADSGFRGEEQDHETGRLQGGAPTDADPEVGTLGGLGVYVHPYRFGMMALRALRATLFRLSCDSCMMILVMFRIARGNRL